ncbi:MAG: hypothetical protein JO283_08390 [Bradyrhizobium sp.]|nr:hypothetical protein [Bradyrhizobium sp.]
MTDLEEFVRFVAHMQTPTDRRYRSSSNPEYITANLGEARLLKNDAETLYALIREARELVEASEAAKALGVETNVRK